MSDSDSPTNASSVSLPLVDLEVVAAVIQRDGYILAAKRLAGGLSGLKWEFPGGKVEAGEAPAQALRREIAEELDLEIEVGAEIGVFSTVQGNHRIHLRCYWCQVLRGTSVLQTHSAVQWCDLEALEALDWAVPDIPVVERIMELQS